MRVPLPFRALPLALAAIHLFAHAGEQSTPAAENPVTVERKDRDAPPPVLRELAFKKIARARELAEAKQFEASLNILERVREDRRSNDYEKATAWSISGFCLNELKRTPEAQAAYRQVMALPEVPESLRISTLYSLAQTHMQADDWKGATVILEQWLARQAEPSAGAYTLLGQAYYQIRDYAKARVPMEKAIEIGRQKGETIRENNYLLLRAIYFGEKDYLRLAEVLKNLVADYPRKEYWVQLGAVYGELDQPLKQLAAMAYAYEQGYLTSAAEYTTLAQLLLANNVPRRAADVVQAGIDKQLFEADAKSYRLLADAFVMAKEYPKAVAALEKAVQHTQNPEMYLRLAQLYMENAQYPQAAASAETALKKGTLNRPDIAHIVSGLSLYELKRLPEARTAFEHAAADERSRAMAQQWQQFIDREQTRLAAMRALGAV
ncbi:MAG: tetratricopeptide repeat protein [Panacagrimonas sp.]